MRSPYAEKRIAAFHFSLLPGDREPDCSREEKGRGMPYVKLRDTVAEL
jgi:hypothetical protein